MGHRLTRTEHGLSFAHSPSFLNSWDVPWLVSAWPELRKMPRVFMLHGPKQYQQDAAQYARAHLGWLPFCPFLIDQWGSHHTKLVLACYATKLVRFAKLSSFLC